MRGPQNSPASFHRHQPLPSQSNSGCSTSALSSCAWEFHVPVSSHLLCGLSCSDEQQTSRPPTTSKSLFHPHSGSGAAFGFHSNNSSNASTSSSCQSPAPELLSSNKNSMFQCRALLVSSQTMSSQQNSENPGLVPCPTWHSPRRPQKVS